MAVRLLLILLLISCGAGAQNESLLTPTAQRADLDSLYAALKANHPSLYGQWPEARAQEAFLRLRSSLGTPLNRTAFFRKLLPFVSSFRDGHTFLSLELDDAAVAGYDAGGGRFFPLQVHILGNRIFSSDSLLGIIPGNELLRVNDMDASALVSYLSDRVPADGPAPARIATERLFGYTLWLTRGWGDSTKVRFRDNRGKLHDTTLPGIALADMTGRIFSGSRLRNLVLYPEKSVALVQIHAYKDAPAAMRFIDSCFRVIRNLGLRNVALDLRRNGGGDSRIGDYFLAHFSQNAAAASSQKIWRNGPLIRALPASDPIRKQMEDARAAGASSEDFISSAGSAEPWPQVPDSLRSNAKLYVLISPRTFSSAHMTALSVKCSGMGRIIGQNTGERLDLTGEVLDYTLPNSKLVVAIPVARYRAACGEGQQIGVAPDIRVTRRPGDNANGRDPELEALFRDAGK